MMAGYDDPLSIRLPKGDRERLERFADEYGLTMSEATRRIIDRGLLIEMEVTQQEGFHVAD